MAGLTRRRFMLLSAVALVGAAACSSPEAAGLRGMGTVLYSRDTDTQPVAEATLVAAEPTPMLLPVPTTAPFAVGQHKGLAGPGQNGNMVLSGHISSPAEGAVFHSLPELKVGEGVIVGTDERQYLYRVTDVKTVTPDQVSVLDQTPDPTVTLITCVPDGIYSHRLVVTARLV